MELPLTADSARDVVLIGPGLTDDSATYKIFFEGANPSTKKSATEAQIPNQYLSIENNSGWYTDAVLSGRSYLTKITSGDCQVKAIYFFSATYTGGAADIMIARSAYPDPTKALESESKTVLDRLGVRKNGQGRWEIKFLSEKTLDKYYCLETEIHRAVNAYEGSVIKRPSGTGSSEDKRGQE